MADVLNPFTENFGENHDSNAHSALALDYTHSDEHDMFRPSIADDQKVGFFSLDRCTQTDTTEIIEIQHLTQTVEQLLDDAASMRRDINFAQNVMQADFETKLQQKAIDLYVRVNDKISDIEKMHEERVATVRRAFKQQLSDAIARMHTIYNRDVAKRMERERTKTGLSTSKWERKCHELQAVIQKNDIMISMLKEQIQEYQDQPRVIARTPSPDHALQAEVGGLREQVLTLEDKVSALEEDRANKEQEIYELTNETENLRDQLEKERIMVEQLNHEKDEIAASIEHDQANSRRQMENAKLSMEKDAEDRIRQIKEQALEEARKEMSAMQSGHREELQRLRDEKQMVEKLLAKEKAKEKARSNDQMELEHLKRNEQRMIAEISKLKREIERVHKTWERKFAILQQSLHALKDESFLRQTMQRQAAQLHQAAISYAYDQPVGIAPSMPQKTFPQSASVPNKKPLPEIPGKPPRAKSPADYISYTVSAPSGRATTVFSIDENQVMSGDEQDIPSDMKPLPSPPVRRITFSIA